jgi:import receptor subunit TOM20
VLSCISSAIYFDHRRRTDPGFRRQLKKESKRQARAAKEEAEAQTAKQRQAVRAAVEEAKQEGFPAEVEEREAYFMQEVARGETLSGDGTRDNDIVTRNLAKHSTGTDNVEAALCFYKALKVYPTPSDLISIYDKTVSDCVSSFTATLYSHYFRYQNQC